MDAVPTTPPAHWPLLLDSPQAISEYIADNSKGYIDRELIEEYMFDAGARLRLVPISEIREGHPEANMRSPKKEARYAKLPLETMPPLVVMDGVVEDGNHRYREAVRRGASALWCYEVLGLDELGIQPAVPTTSSNLTPFDFKSFAL